MKNMGITIVMMVMLIFVFGCASRYKKHNFVEAPDAWYHYQEGVYEELQSPFISDREKELIFSAFLAKVRCERPDWYTVISKQNRWRWPDNMMR